MIKIVKASAGSGKTYTLAREYIRLLLLGTTADTYRHILAVTFTNKATDEMKRRILDELYILAKDPKESDYYDDFHSEKEEDERIRNMSDAEMQDRCARQLSNILHDYSAFAVSTIDRFFQQTLRAFSREIGQFSAYQVSLDKEELVDESVDRVLSSLTPENPVLVNWLVDGVRDNLRRNSRFSLDSSLRAIAMSLRSDDYAQAASEHNMDEEKLWSRENLDRVRKELESIVDSFEKQVPPAAQDVLDCLKLCGVTPEDSNRGFLKALYSYTATAPVDKPLTPAFLKNASDSKLWFSKSKDDLRLRCEGTLEGPLNKFTALFDEPLKLYNTARIIHRQLYNLGVAGELRKAFAQIQQEKNILSIDDSNAILKGIIDGTDTPFVYEKTGVRFDSFLLDEFQDTSDIQWENFLPLLHNSEAGSGGNLIVGDVKQSIYRWRGSDWNLLGSGVRKEFPRSRETSLKENYRTCKNIVEFNNSFFEYAAANLDIAAGLASPDNISGIYADVSQVAKFDEADGSVDVVFCEKQEDEMDEIMDTLRELRERGCLWSDVAILVRGNDDGSAIAARLVSEGIPVVSDDSLFVKSSVTVRRAVSQMVLVDSPVTEGKNRVNSYLASTMNVDIPDNYHSLVDLAEEILRDLRDADGKVFEAEIPYIQSFVDYIQDWSALNGNSLSGFLLDWEEAQPKIASPEGGDAVRIMTVHKSKGLEFNYVIFPFAEKVTLYKASSHWCKPSAGGTALEGVAEGIFPVLLSSGSENSLFGDKYRKELKLQLIDNINVFYVALTRPKFGLKVIAQSTKKDAPPAEWKNFAHILRSYTKTDRYQLGLPCDFSAIKRKSAKETRLSPGYPSWKERGRLRFSEDACDYFGPDGSVGTHASNRRRGIVLHNILSSVVVPEDLPGAVDAAVMSGELEASDRDSALAFLAEELEGVKQYGWFTDPSARILNEASILVRGEKTARPDRVIVRSDGSVDIVDYKFGQEEEKYASQLRRYARLFKQMGYSPVSTYIWYLREDSPDEIVKN